MPKPRPNPRTVLVPRLGDNGKTILETVRLNLGLDVSALARLAGVSRDIIWRLEQPKVYSRRPYPATCRKIAAALGKEIPELFAQVPFAQGRTEGT